MSDSLPTETKAILCRKWTAMMPLHSEPHRGFWGQLHLQMRSLVTLPNASVRSPRLTQRQNSGGSGCASRAATEPSGQGGRARRRVPVRVEGVFVNDKAPRTGRRYNVERRRAAWRGPAGPRG